MTETKFNPYKNLCWYDPRNPDYIPPDDYSDSRTPRDECSCDNCFYGRDAMALEIISLVEKNEVIEKAAKRAFDLLHSCGLRNHPAWFELRDAFAIPKVKLERGNEPNTAEEKEDRG